jgi:hypothetical protein
MMKQLTLNIDSGHYDVFKAFIATLDYATIIAENNNSNSSAKNTLLQSVENGLKEAELIRRGDIKALSMQDILDEL